MSRFLVTVVVDATHSNASLAIIKEDIASKIEDYIAKAADYEGQSGVTDITKAEVKKVERLR